MEEFAKYFRIAALICFVVGFIYIVNIDSNKGFDKVIETIEKDEYFGHVSNKYIDKKNHNEPMILLSTGKKISLYGQQYDKIDVGDSLSKKMNTTVIEVYKKDRVITINQKDYIEMLKKRK